MSKNQAGIDWFNENIKPLLGSDFKFTFVNKKDSDLGELSGVQFDSDKKGGYIYFWSSGFVGYQLVDYDKELELVEDATEEVGFRSYNEIFNDLILNLK